MKKLIRIAEPLLLFGHSQGMEDPRDGLTLFGPHDPGGLFGIRAGVIGTQIGVEKFNAWTQRIQRPVRTKTFVQSRPPFSGFEAVFRVPWGLTPVQTITIDAVKLNECLFQDDRFRRVFDTVELFASAIAKAQVEEEAKPDLWFVVIPDEVRKYCRPKSIIEPSVRIEAKRFFASSLAKNIQRAKEVLANPSLFPEENEEAEPYSYKEHFRNQLKARLLPHKVSTQVVRESTIGNIDAQPDTRQGRTDELLQSQIAWNLSTTAFYKSGARPWKVSGIREGVAYIGLVFKRHTAGAEDRSCACGAQMFQSPDKHGG
jgi:hypothetical protein